MFLLILIIGGAIIMRTADRLKTDPQLEKDGVWLDYGDYAFRVARPGGSNKLYLRTLENKIRPLRRAIANDAVPNERIDQILQDVYLETVILDWKYVEDDKGQQIPFSVDAVREFFKEVPDAWINVREDAQKASLFRKYLQEESAKN